PEKGRRPGRAAVDVVAFGVRDLVGVPEEPGLAQQEPAPGRGIGADLAEALAPEERRDLARRQLPGRHWPAALARGEDRGHPPGVLPLALGALAAGGEPAIGPGSAPGVSDVEVHPPLRAGEDDLASGQDVEQGGGSQAAAGSEGPGGPGGEPRPPRPLTP